MFWAKIPITQLLYLRGWKKKKKNGADSGNRKIRQAMRKADSALLVALGQAEGTAAVPTFSRAGTNASCCTPSFYCQQALAPHFSPMEKSRVLLSAVCHHQPRRQSWHWNYSTALPPLGWGSLRALTQNLGLQHERLENLWVLCLGNQIFCLINPLKNQMQKRFVWIFWLGYLRVVIRTGTEYRATQICCVKIPFLCLMR